MKLRDDINTLIEARGEYDRLNAFMKGRHDIRSIVLANGEPLQQTLDVDIYRIATTAVAAAIEKKFEEQKSRLMMLGVTDFGEG